ncbi:MAG TPA: alkaline phosphatase family protein, partial [Thermoanaerobaculia bacterium]|nr:alkaline phosphatase family protein [Thermoanaerobaculia bacterium]
SSYYQFNPRVLDFNERLESFIAANPRWEPLQDVAGGAVRTDDPPELRQHKGSSAGSTQFPHEVTSVGQFLYTPFANDLVLEFARHVIDVEWMGREDGAPDVLWVGLSAMDYLGHLYGPDSLEVADAVLRLDRSLAVFLDDLERRFGDRVTVAVTADHGIQAIPELARARGRDAGRVAFGYSANRVKTIGEMPPHRRTLETRIAQRLGVELPAESPVDHRLILRTTTPNFYLNWPRIEALGLDPESVRRATRDSLLEIEGVAEAFTASDLSVVRAPKSEIERAARLSFYADRSGDVIAYLKPGWIYSGGTTGSTHGQAVEADQHVLLMLWGNGIPARRIDSRVEIQQLARSLGHLLGIDAGTPDAPPLPGLE